MKWQCSSCDKTGTKKEHFEYCYKNRHSVIRILDDKDVQKLTTKTTSTTQKGKMVKKVKGIVGDYYVESILVDSKPTFLCLHKPTGILELHDMIDTENYTVKPVEKNDCGYFPYSFTNREINQLISSSLSKEELLDEIKIQIDKFIYVSNIDKHLLLGDLLLTYCQEWISTTHFLFVVGENESGKSSVLHLFKWLSYRCLYGEGISEANIYNFLGTDEESTGTIAEDELQGLEYNKEKLGIYKNSYSKGSVKPRVLILQNTKSQVYYKTFCFKIFGGEKLPQDKGFVERLSVIRMLEGEPHSNIKRVTPEEELELNSLRNKLLFWKVSNVDEVLHRTDSGLKQRDQELWEDFLTVTSGTKYYKESKDVVEHYTRQRHEKIWNSFESRIFKLLTEHVDNNFEINFETFWTSITTDHVELPGELDRGTFYSNEFTKFTRNTLSRLFQDKFLGEKKVRTEKDESGRVQQKTLYTFKQEVIQKLVKKYNIVLPIDHPVYSGSSGQCGQMQAVLNIS